LKGHSSPASTGPYVLEVKVTTCDAVRSDALLLDESRLETVVDMLDAFGMEQLIGILISDQVDSSGLIKSESG